LRVILPAPPTNSINRAILDEPKYRLGGCERDGRLALAPARRHRDAGDFVAVGEAAGDICRFTLVV
jgi:hypothetical protein